jgi:hypothetical protein
MKQSLLKSSILLTTFSLLIFSACKKETTTPDDPNIVHVTINKTLTTFIGGNTVDSIDFNRDGLCELVLVIQNINADTGFIQKGPKSQYIDFAIAGLTPAPYVKLFQKGDVQPTSNSAYDFAPYFSIKTSGYRFGILDNGDKYLTFRFKTGTKFNYGWMKVNVNSTFTELKIIDYAYSILPDTPIAVGAE